ncbi:MAG TPA: branched-chain amino acid ABC transporter permease [Gallicola sp.]|nr:AzlC family ABC transporter permease [Bacillota bacterium]HHX70305.1 branched-chain amino acid ABC transporter permease [Gallicola sp.]
MKLQKHKEALKAAFPYTIPVLTGYLLLGAAFGILMDSKGYSLIWVIFVSLFVYAGSMQFVAVGLVASGFHPINAMIMTLMVNARHLFYGIATLPKFKGLGKKKWYLIHGLTDETFSILSSIKEPKHVDRSLFLFYITLLDHIYWVTGSALGSVLGNFIPFDTRGLDFVLTALFVVVFIEQLLSKKSHLPEIIGAGSAILCRLVFGAESFLIPTMLLILVLVTVFRKQLEGGS